LIEKPGENLNSWSKCIDSNTKNSSVYNHCEKLFQYNKQQNTNCKLDMCKLCCVSTDLSNQSQIQTHFSETSLKNGSEKSKQISSNNFEKCEKACVEKFI
jgi:hypothetical protein